MASEILGQSDSSSRPLRIRVASTRASEHSMRWVSSRWLISSENTSTGTRACTAACFTMPRAKLVLPMAGRAPTTTRFDFCRPASWSSRSRVAGGHAGDGVAALEEALEMVEALGQQVPQRRHGVDQPALGHLEDHRLGPVDHLGRRPRGRCSRARRSRPPPRPAAAAGRAPRRSGRSARRWPSTACSPAARSAPTGRPRRRAAPTGAARRPPSPGRPARPGCRAR